MKTRTNLVTKRKNYGEIIKTADAFGNIIYVLVDRHGNFVESSNNYNKLHDKLYNKTTI